MVMESLTMGLFRQCACAFFGCVTAGLGKLRGVVHLGRGSGAQLCSGMRDKAAPAGAVGHILGCNGAQSAESPVAWVTEIPVAGSTHSGILMPYSNVWCPSSLVRCPGRRPVC